VIADHTAYINIGLQYSYRLLREQPGSA